MFVRLDWKSLPGANTTYYYENSKITVVKSFITLGPDCQRTAGTSEQDKRNSVQRYSKGKINGAMTVSLTTSA